MLDQIETVALLASILVVFLSVAIALRAPPAWRIGLVAGGLAWTPLAWRLGATGQLSFAPRQPVPLIGVMAAAPVAAGILALWLSPGARRALTGLPMPLLIGVNAVRVLGVSFLLLAQAGRLSGPFPYSAGWGDIITGVLAVPLALFAWRSRPAVAVWNLFGMLDLLAALFLGVTSAQGGRLQLFHVGVGSDAVQHLPYCLIPTVLVPFFMLTHVIIAAQLVGSAKSAEAGAPAPSRA